MSFKVLLWKIGLYSRSKKKADGTVIHPCPICHKPLYEHYGKEAWEGYRYTCSDDDCKFNEKWAKYYKPEEIKSKKPTLSIIVLNRNKKDLTLECLRSISEQTVKPNEVIIIDNASGDDSFKAIDKYIGDKKYMRQIRLTYNMGFCAGNNAGIKEAKSYYIMILNNDTILEKRCVEKIMKKLNENYYYEDMFSLTMRLPNGDIDTYGIGRKKSGIFYDVKEPHKIHSIIGPCGGAAIYTRTLLEDVKDCNGYFDSRYFIYCEDADLAMRAQRKNYHHMHIDAEIIHHHGATNKTIKKTCYYLAIRNRIATYMKGPKKNFIRFLFMQGVVFWKYLILERMNMGPAISDGFTGNFTDFEILKKRYKEDV